MGIAKAAAQLLLAEHARRPFSGAALELGRQDCVFTREELAAWAAARGVTLARVEEKGSDRRRATMGSLGMDDGELFEALGFDEVRSVDASAFEGADLVCDLNEPLPTSLHGRFDLAYNGGTLEHVFDLPAALRNVHAALKIGGRAIHMAPCSNQIDHGFYSFSPALFWDYYAANDYDIVTAYVFQARDFESPWTVYRYAPGALDGVTARFHDVRASGVTVAGLWFVVEKTERSTAGKVPQQGQYVREWEEKARVEEPQGLRRRVRDAKRRLDRAVPVLNPQSMPSKVGVFG